MAPNLSSLMIVALRTVAIFSATVSLLDALFVAADFCAFIQLVKARSVTSPSKGFPKSVEFAEVPFC